MIRRVVPHQFRANKILVECSECGSAWFVHPQDLEYLQWLVKVRANAVCQETTILMPVELPCTYPLLMTRECYCIWAAETVGCGSNWVLK